MIKLSIAFALLLTTCTGHAAGLPTPDAHWTRMMDYYSRQDANVPDGAVIVVGDSLVQGLSTTALGCPVQNYGIGSQTTRGMLTQLARLTNSTARASLVVFHIGVNDMRYVDDAYIISQFVKMIAKVPSNVPVLLSAIHPIDEPARTNWEGRSNARILAFNLQLQALAVGRVHFIDAGSTLRGPDGNLLTTLHVGDGVHLNSDGNALWLIVLEAAITGIL